MDGFRVGHAGGQDCGAVGGRFSQPQVGARNGLSGSPKELQAELDLARCCGRAGDRGCGPRNASRI